MSYKEKQVLVVRKDLNMRKGKMVAQGAHASMKVFFDRATVTETLSEKSYMMLTDLTEEMYRWSIGMFAKICVSVNSEAELLEVYEKAQAAGIPCALITDSGLTEFNGVPTNTVVAIGPDLPERIDPITGHLPLL